MIIREDIQSSLGPFRVLPGYKVKYPVSVIRALADLYAEYNRAFAPLIAKNHEWETDYCFCEHQGQLINFGVQIDMVGLPEEFLRVADTMPIHDVREILRRSIFEIENSLAMYQLLAELFSENGASSYFKQNFRACLDSLRKRFGMPVALLAVTDQKYVGMATSEFGVMDGSIVSPDTVSRLSGFDRFFSPAEFREHIEENGGECRYLLYVRSSDPIEKLKKPGVSVEHPLLADPEMRRVIRAHALTFNIDRPGAPYPELINDTKEYAPHMGMAFQVSGEAGIFAPEFMAHLDAGRPYAEFAGNRLSERFVDFLTSYGVNPQNVALGKSCLRAKPAKCTYGCYGHVRGSLPDRKFRAELRAGLRQRGAYVIQPEMATPKIVNTNDETSFTYIDRNFFGYIGGQPTFFGGFRDLMPEASVEARNARVHGNSAAVWAEILPA